MMKELLTIFAYLYILYLPILKVNVGIVHVLLLFIWFACTMHAWCDGKDCCIPLSHFVNTFNDGMVPESNCILCCCVMSCL